MRIIVLGYVIRGPLGGAAWHHLQYVLGLADLGHDVYFLEDSDDYPACYDPTRHGFVTDPGYGLAFAKDAFDRLGLGDRWAYYDAHTGRWLGAAAGVMPDRCATADVLLNVSAINPLRPWTEDVPVRVLIDTDPVFTQIDLVRDPWRARLADAHTAFFTFGESFGRYDCAIPDDGRPWRPTRQPVVLRAWPLTPGRRDGPFTTVMQWDSYPSREYRGVRYGMKAESMEPFLDLPARTGATFELALGSEGAPREYLEARGWRLRDPLGITRDPWTYQDYIRGSKAEFSVAKHGYVVSRSGWFSERSASYLASGRPVVVQDTGFSRHLPVGEGILAFSTAEEASEAIAEIDDRYERHCRAARELAQSEFDSRRVLGALLDAAVGGEPGQAGQGPGKSSAGERKG